MRCSCAYRRSTMARPSARSSGPGCRSLSRSRSRWVSRWRRRSLRASPSAGSSLRPVTTGATSTGCSARDLLADTPARLVTGAWLDKVPPPAWWVHGAQSGGQVVEQPTHLLDCMLDLVGDVEGVFAVGGRDERAGLPDADIGDSTAAVLRFARGAVGSLTATSLLRVTARHGTGERGARLRGASDRDQRDPARPRRGRRPGRTRGPRRRQAARRLNVHRRGAGAAGRGARALRGGAADPSRRLRHRGIRAAKSARRARRGCVRRHP